MFDEDLLNIRILSQTFHKYAYLVAFLFQFLFPITGDIVFRMVSGDKHKWHQQDFLRSIGLYLGYHRIKSRIALDGSYGIILESLLLQHIIQHGILSRRRSISAMAYQ